MPASQHQNPKSDIEISQAAKKRPIIELAKERLGIAAENLEPYGHYKAKVSMEYVRSLKDKKNGKLILVTAISRSISSARRPCSACASRRSARRLV
jgi:formate--tetrahydrofolate ligase